MRFVTRVRLAWRAALDSWKSTSERAAAKQRAEIARHVEQRRRAVAAMREADEARRWRAHQP